MKMKHSRKAHWANQLILLTGLLFCMVSVQAQSPAPATLRVEVHKPLAAAQEALKNNQTDERTGPTAVAFCGVGSAIARAVVLQRGLGQPKRWAVGHRAFDLAGPPTGGVLG
jgi:hypothetical protein